MDFTKEDLDGFAELHKADPEAAKKALIAELDSTHPRVAGTCPECGQETLTVRTKWARIAGGFQIYECPCGYRNSYAFM